MDRSVSIKRIARLFGLVLLFTLVFAAFGKNVSARADEEIRLNVTETAIAKDGVFRLRIYNVPKNSRILYRSSDTSVATLKCNITVGPAAISIKLTKSELVLSVGMKKTLKTIISPLNTVEKPVFYSSDKEVASVSSIGRVRAKGVGEASVFAFLLNGESAECQIYVLDEESYEKYLETGNLEGLIDVDNGNEDENENGGSEENPDGQTITGTPSETGTTVTPEATPTPVVAE